MTTLLHTLGTALLFVLVLAVLVLVHELGHYLAARLFKIDVEEFGFGFPPRATGVKKWGTIWSLNWIPLGGFVKLKGEDDPHDVGHGSFASKSAGVRAAVIAAGVIMNLILSSTLFAAGFMIGVPQLVDDLPKNAQLHDRRIQVMEVLPDSPAAKADLRPGDAIMTLDGQTLADITAIQEYVAAHDGKTVHVVVTRGPDAVTEDLVPAVIEGSGGKAIMGVALAETAIVSFPVHVALLRGFAATGYYAKEIVVSVWQLIAGLVTTGKSKVDFSGPVGIAVLTGRVARLGFTYLLQFVGLLSVNLAVINILPIPALDGGRLMFVIVEKLRGKAVRPKVEAALHKIVFFLLLGLALLVTLKDVDRYKQQILDLLKSVFGIT